MIRLLTTSHYLKRCKIFGVSIPSGAAVPITSLGVPLATGRPGETASSAIPSASSSLNGMTSGSAGGSALNAGLKNPLGSLLTISCILFTVGFVSVGARTDHDADGDFDFYIPSCALRCSDRLTRGPTAASPLSLTEG